MVSLLASWVLFPAILLLISLGCGLLAERVAGRPLPGVLLLPVGLGVVVVATQFAATWDATAEFATPLIIALGVVGLALSYLRLRNIHFDYWAVAAAAAVFAVYAAPVVLSGEATFAGYTLNGESAIHFIGVDNLTQHGRSVSELAPSSYQLCLKFFWGSGYPLGAETPLGAARPLVGEDVAWVFQPYIALLVAMAALSMYALVERLIERRAHRAAVVFIAAQPALLYAYGLQASLKEIAAMWAVVLVAALVTLLLDQRDRVRTVVPLAVATAAAIAIINVVVMIWIAPLLIVGVVLLARANGRVGLRLTVKQIVLFVVAAGVMAGPTLYVAGDLLKIATGQLTQQSGLSAASGLGDLLGPLNNLQVLGIWLTGDFRVPPESGVVTINFILIGIALVAGMIGLMWTARRRAVGPLLYVVVSGIACAVVVSKGSPWGDAKALAITSPAIMLAIVLGPVALLKAGRRPEALMLGGAVALGVLWSNALAYHAVNLAPKERLAELDKVGKLIAGQGPTVYTEYEEHGKHFLRRANPEGRTEGCQTRFGVLRGGQYPREGFSTDLDQVTARYLLHFRTIVLRRGPRLSRPPAIYHLIYSGKHYEVWQRPTAPAQRVVAHLPLGDGLQPAQRPDCDRVRRLAGYARRIGGRLAYVERAPVLGFVPAMTRYPPAWSVDPSDSDVLIPRGPGQIAYTVTVTRPGGHTVWLEGSFGRGYTVQLDGRTIGDVRYTLSGRGQSVHVADVDLTRGKHVVTLIRGGGDLRPGNGLGIRKLGPLVIAPVSAMKRDVQYLNPKDYRRLCRRHLDWIEVVKKRPVFT